MEHKVLIADDSLTIQKVIRITLSAESYEMLDCDNTTKLYEIVEKKSPAIVYLDFTLDDGLSGYDVCRKILKISPQTQVMMMYGTFDSIDEEEHSSCGAAAKITKPFDGQKFITMTHQLINSQEYVGIEGDEKSLSAVEKHLEQVSSELNIDEPVVDEPMIMEDKEEILDDPLEIDFLVENSQKDEEVFEINEVDIDLDLGAEINWEVKDEGLRESDETLNIESDLREVELDQVEKDNLRSEVAAMSEDFSFNDVLGEGLNRWEMSVPDVIEPHWEASENLPRAEDSEEVEGFDFSQNANGEFEANKLIDFEQGLSEVKQNDEKFEAIQSELESELNIDDDLWKVDDTELVSEAVSDELLGKKSDLISSVDKNDIELAVRNYMDEHGRAIIEKIAWEMIPDLAENIIREEVKKLADKALKS